jgi:hypothetical protein
MTSATTDRTWDYLSQYDPHPRQRAFHLSRAEKVLFGGAAGPGKRRP